MEIVDTIDTLNIIDYMVKIEVIVDIEGEIFYASSNNEL